MSSFLRNGISFKVALPSCSHGSLLIYVTGKPQLTTEEYPLDTDTTSLALTILGRDKKIAFPIMDEILADWVNEDGIILVSGQPSLPFSRQC